jgi:myo-inositol catabolism protein IolS
MQFRRFGKTGWQVSTISMGCWGIGGQWGPVAESEAIRTIHAAIDLGVNLYDTADAYGQGLSEELVGKAMKGKRDGLIIATKVGNFARRAGAPLSYSSPEHVYLCCDASLKRLEMDTIDFYQCHIGNLEGPSIFLEAFERLLERGKIRSYGISTNSLAVAKAFNRNGTCSGIQLNYSLLNPGAADDLLPWCAENDIGTLIRGPIAQGVLAGKFTPQSTFTDTVRTPWNSGPAHDQFLDRVKKVEQIRFLQSPDRTMAQAALQWVIANPAVTCAIPGAKDVAQITSNAEAADGALSDAELAQLGAVTAPW